MAGRAFRRVRVAGADEPEYNVQTWECLCWGFCLIAWPTEFDWTRAEEAWRLYRSRVLADWAAHHAPNSAPLTWAERKFDGATPAILPKHTMLKEKK